MHIFQVISTNDPKPDLPSTHNRLFIPFIHDLLLVFATACTSVWMFSGKHVEKCMPFTNDRSWHTPVDQKQLTNYPQIWQETSKWYIRP